MPPTFKLRPTAPLLIALAALATSCAVVSPLSRPVAGPEIPPLPASARQPGKPSICSPTCSDALTRERESWLPTPTPPAPQEKPASAPT